MLDFCVIYVSLILVYSRIWLEVSRLEKRSGSKFGGDHSTLIDLAAELADIAVRLPEVKRISPGFIQSGQSVTGGDRRVKFADMNGGLLLKVRQSRSVQEIRILTDQLHVVRLALARAARDMGVSISFQKPS